MFHGNVGKFHKFFTYTYEMLLFVLISTFWARKAAEQLKEEHFESIELGQCESYPDRIRIRIQMTSKIQWGLPCSKTYIYVL